MALLKVNVGSAPDDGTGDTLRSAFVKVNTAIDHVDSNTDALAAIHSQSSGTVRMAWKPAPTPGGSLLQQPTTDNAVEPITYSHVLTTSPHMTGDAATGVFEVTEAIDTITMQFNVQVIREAGGGTDHWGILLQASGDGINWTNVEDSTRVISFAGNDDGQIKHISYGVSGTSIPVGAQYRLAHIRTGSQTDHIGIVTSDIWSGAAPLAAGIVVSVFTTATT